MSKEKYSQSERKTNLLNEQIECFKLLIAACEEIKAGASETFVCSKYNIDRKAFRSIIFDKCLGFKHDPLDTPPLDENDPRYDNYWQSQWKDYCWQEKLFCDVFKEYNINNIPDSIGPAVDIVLDTLDEREKQILLYRYQDQKTLREIAQILERTPDRVRQIEQKALRKLRHPSRANILKYGLQFVELENDKKQKLEERRKQCEATVNALHKKMEKTITLKEKQDLIDMKKEIEKELVQLDDKYKVSTEDLSVFTISDMKLSVRTYNSVRRAGYQTVKDFVGLKYSQLLNIRNLGQKSLEELVGKLKEYGVEPINDLEDKKH